MSGFAIEAYRLSKRFPVHAQRRTSIKERLVRGRAPEKQYFWALREATFSVPKGSSLGIIGHNGSGKSTALKVLTGIYRPTSGHVRVNGSVSALLEVGAGFHPELSGRENIRLNATILGFTARQIDAMMDQIIEFADIGDHIDAPIKHYSSGMYVRLGFAVAVMVRPETLIVDEVIAVGDEEFQRKCYDYLDDLRRSGTSMIIVSHGLSQITDLCDEAIWLDKGRVRRHGASQSVVRDYVASVNRAEAEKALPTRQAGVQAATGPDPALEATAQLVHRGTGEIRVADVQFLDGRGDAVPFLITGEPAIVRLEYVATESIDEVQFGLGFDNSLGTVACTVYTQPEELVSVEPGRGVIEFRTDQFLLAAGVYGVRLGVTRKKHVVDAIDSGLKVTFRESDVAMRGTYYQPGSWSVTTAAGPGPYEEQQTAQLGAEI